MKPVGGRDAMSAGSRRKRDRGSPVRGGTGRPLKIIAGAGGLLASGMFAGRRNTATSEWHGGEPRGDAIETENESGRPALTGPSTSARYASTSTKRAKRSFGYWNKLDYFLERSVFRAGLRVQCPTCAHYSWFEPGRDSYSFHVQSVSQAVQVRAGPERPRRSQWFYRVIGPFAAPDYGRGGYAVALTLRCLAERHETEMT